MQANEMKPQFIGQAALEQVATKIEPEIVMGPAFSRAGYFERMGFKVISGIQFKDIAYVMNRKGLTTVRKVVGKEVNSAIGYLEERPMVCKLTWNHYTDNKRSYQENPVINPEGGNYTYPASELAMKAILASYGEDLLNDLWHGDDELPDDNELGLFTGFITYLGRDLVKGRISTAQGNLVNCATIEAPTTPTDIGALTAFDAWYNGWNPKLQNQEKVLVYGTKETLFAIADAYANSKNQYKEANFLPTGNFVIPRYANVEFCPDPLMGQGDKIIATIPGNFQYGVDTENEDTFIGVKVGTDKDMGEIQFQVQSVQGTRVLNVNSSVFCMSNGTLTHRSLSGDYTKDTYIVLSSDTTLGTVTVNGAAADNTKNYAQGTTLSLAATPKTGASFVKWSNGATAQNITVVTKGQPEAITAIFKANDESDESD